MNAMDILGAVQTDWPRQIFKARAKIISPGASTDVAFIIHSGTASGFEGVNKRQYGPGDLIATLDFLALDTYPQAVTASTQVTAFVLSREAIRLLIDRQHHLTWPLSCMLAIDIQKRSHAAGVQ